MTDKFYRRYFVNFTAHSIVKNEIVTLGAVFELDEEILNGHQIDSLGAFMSHHSKMDCKVNTISFLGMSTAAQQGDGVIKLERHDDEVANAPVSAIDKPSKIVL